MFVPRARRSTKCCGADPGSRGHRMDPGSAAHHFATLRAALRPGNVAPGPTRKTEAFMQRIIVVFLTLLLSCALATAQTPAPVLARQGMGASEESRASRIGVEVLQQGGNAVDAAVAVGFALAVTHPQAGNIGGGGFMVIHLAERNEDIAIDYRETAPAATTRDVFLDDKGEADPRKSRDSGLGIGVPGTVAGLALALER